jgi:uncharacterized protein (TIGR03083 family)
MLESEDFQRVLAAAAHDFAAILVAGDPDALVATCPGWNLTDLSRHLGTVHRWAAACIRTGTPADETEGPTVQTGLLPWFREGAEDLLDLLAERDPQEPSWTFGPRPRVVGFWSRRQAHETVMHLWDARHSQGFIDPLESRLAADGVDEVCTMFFPRQVRLKRISPLREGLRLVATDVPGFEAVLAGDGTDPRAVVDTTAYATASDLLLGLWGRRGGSDWVVEGNPEVIGRVLSAGVVP